MNFAKSQLNVSHLKMISTIASSDTVKEAAERLFITQPALTNRIREAERRLNTELFVRRGRKLIITSSGKRLLYSANKILEELARAEHDISRLSDGVEQVVRLGVPNYSSLKWLPKAINHFEQTLPHVELEIIANSQQQPIQALYNGDVDVALICSAHDSIKLDDHTYKSQCVVKDELQALLAKDNPLTKKNYLVAEDFRQATYITNSTVPEKDREYELFFKPANVIPKKVMQVGFNEAIVDLVNVNLGVTIMAKTLLEPYLLTHQVSNRTLTNSGLAIYWHVAYGKQPAICSAASELINVLQQQ
ncbi:LysR family transcriptional regulator [Thalassotalea maritima]|uniref:LysR family transcriptional regulator n=1 Tax=Thalassotalea maritima TaxID=3242416 RepID=UPI003527514F